ILWGEHPTPGDVMPLPPPSAVLFDLGGTLLNNRDFRPHEWLTVLASWAPGLDLEFARTQFDALLPLHPGLRQDGGLEPRPPAAPPPRRPAAPSPPPLVHAEVELRFWQAAVVMAPLPGVEAMLDRLAARGLPLGVISNSTWSGSVLESVLAEHGLARHLRFV